MAFTTEQIQLLKNKLDGNKVATRSNGRMQLSYIEGYHAIEEANRIFNFDAWSYSVKRLTKISEEKNTNNNTVVGYEALVEVRVMAGGQVVIREDVGYGSGIAKDAFSAFEGAGKEAVTDALKRALRTFGNAFGLALYDKEQKNVDYDTQERSHIVDEAEKLFDAKSTKVIDYKDEIANFIIGLGVKADDLPECASVIMKGGLDISNNPKDVWLNSRKDLKETVELFVGLSA